MGGEDKKEKDILSTGLRVSCSATEQRRQGSNSIVSTAGSTITQWPAHAARIAHHFDPDLLPSTRSLFDANSALIKWPQRE